MAAADIPSVEAVAIVCKYPTDLIIPLTVLNPATIVPTTTAVAPTLRPKPPTQVSEIELITLIIELPTFSTGVKILPKAAPAVTVKFSILDSNWSITPASVLRRSSLSRFTAPMFWS